MRFLTIMFERDNEVHHILLGYNSLARISIVALDHEPLFLALTPTPLNASYGSSRKSSNSPEISVIRSVIYPLCPAVTLAFSLSHSLRLIQSVARPTSCDYFCKQLSPIDRRLIQKSQRAYCTTSQHLVTF